MMSRKVFAKFPSVTKNYNRYIEFFMSLPGQKETFTWGINVNPLDISLVLEDSTQLKQVYA